MCTVSHPSQILKKVLLIVALNPRFVSCLQKYRLYVFVVAGVVWVTVNVENSAWIIVDGVKFFINQRGFELALIASRLHIYFTCKRLVMYSIQRMASSAKSVKKNTPLNVIGLQYVMLKQIKVTSNNGLITNVLNY